jgi:hypothetical protein
MAYTYYGGRSTPYAASPALSLSPGLKRLSEKERKAVQRQRAKHEAMMSGTPGSMNRNLEKFVDEYSRGSSKKPEHFDDAILELEAAVDRLLELRHEAQLKYDRRLQIAEKLKADAAERVVKKKARAEAGLHGYLDKMNTIAPFKNPYVTIGAHTIGANPPNASKWWNDELGIPKKN